MDKRKEDLMTAICLGGGLIVFLIFINYCMAYL